MGGVPQQPVGLLEVERFRVELPADPRQATVVFLVLRIGDGLQELGVIEDASHILGRTGPSTR